jgi:hypothetical protein
MASLKAEFAKAFGNSLTTQTLTSCSRWAVNRRWMGGDFEGPYGFRFHPWCRELHDTWATFNYCMKGAQLGITEIAINRALYTLDKLKRDVLYVLPTTKNASKFSKGRFSTALALSPYVRSMFTDLNSMDLKQAGTNCLYIVGSRGDNNLKSIPVSELILDEVDEMEQKQIWLALERLSGQLTKHIWGISTPTIPGYGIHKLYLGSTQEHFNFQCPSCSRWTELIWPDCIEIVGEHETDARCAESFIKCKECKAKLDHAAKPEFLAAGKWVATAPNANKDVRGFHINQLYSSTVTPGELVQAHFRGFGDEFANKEFHNSKLGMPFIGDGARVTEEMADRSVREHSMDDLRPARGGERLITLGCDQGKTCYYVACEWLFKGKPGKDIGAAAICKVLCAGRFPEDDWGYLDSLMSEWQVLYAVVDADPQVNEARRFARRFSGFVGLTRYRKGQTGKEIATSEEEGGAPVHTIDRTSWLSGTLNRFKSDPPRILLPRDIQHEFKQHMGSLVRTYEKDEHGQPVAVYKELGPDHWAHALTYAEVALTFAPYSTSQNISSAP